MALFRRGTTKTEAPILPMGIGNVHTAVNTKHLRQKLIDIGETRDGERAEVMAALREELDTAKALATEMFEKGRLNGLEMARRISAIHDDILCALYDYTVHYVVRASNPTAAVQPNNVFLLPKKTRQF